MNFLTQVAPFAPFATALVVAITFWKSMRIQRSLKQQDVMASFQKRYEEVRYDLLLKAQNGKYPTDLFFLRFWNLQIDQFKAWDLGYIPDDVYIEHWLNERRAECNIGPIKEVTWLAGWDKAKAIMGQKKFCAFMERVLRQSVADAVAHHRG